MCTAADTIWLVTAVALTAFPFVMVFAGFIEKKRIERRGRIHVSG